MIAISSRQYPRFGLPESEKDEKIVGKSPCCGQDTTVSLVAHFGDTTIFQCGACPEIFAVVKKGQEAADTGPDGICPMVQPHPYL